LGAVNLEGVRYGEGQTRHAQISSSPVGKPIGAFHAKQIALKTFSDQNAFHQASDFIVWQRNR
jgi:hypothetical protein